MVGYCDAFGPRLVLAFDDDAWRGDQSIAGTFRPEARWNRGAECGVFLAHRGKDFEQLAAKQPVAARVRSAPNTFGAFKESRVLPALRVTLALLFASVAAFALSVLRDRSGKVTHFLMLVVLWGNIAIPVTMSVVSALHGWGTADPPLVASVNLYFILSLFGLSSSLDCLLAGLWNIVRGATSGQEQGGGRCLSRPLFFGMIGAFVALLGVLVDVFFSTDNRATLQCLIAVGAAQLMVSAVLVVGACRLMHSIEALADGDTAQRCRPLLVRLSRAEQGGAHLRLYRGHHLLFLPRRLQDHESLTQRVRLVRRRLQHLARRTHVGSGLVLRPELRRRSRTLSSVQARRLRHLYLCARHAVYISCNTHHGTTAWPSRGSANANGSRRQGVRG